MANGREIAAAYVALVPSARGIRSNLESELRGPARQAGQTAGREIEDGITAGTQSAGRKAAGLLASTLGSAAIVSGLNRAKDAASGLQQAVGGTEAVFGQLSGTIDEFADRSAETVGLSARAAREFTSQIGAALKGYGFAVDDAADKSIELTSLGADLAATFGGTVPEAVTALSAALRGEFDPLERYGVSLRASDIAARAVKDGLAVSESSVSNYAKAQATLASILEQTADAQGQFARESESAAGQAAISTAKTEDATASLGEVLLPIYAKVSETVGTAADVFAALPGSVQTGVVALAGIVAVAGPVTRTIDLYRTLRPAAAQAAAAIETTGTAAQNSAASVSNLYTNTSRASTAMKALKGAGVALAGAGIAVALYDIAQNSRKIKVDVEAALQSTTDELKRSAAFAKGLRGDTGLKDFLQPLIDSGPAGVAAVVEIRDAFSDAGEDVTVFDEVLRGAAEGQSRLNDRTEAGEGALEDYGLKATDAAGAIEEVADEALTATDVLESFNDRLDDGVSALRDFFGAASSPEEAMISFRDNLRDIAGLQAEVADGTLTGQERIDEFAGKILNGRDAILDYAESLITSGTPLEEVTSKVQAMVDQLFDQADQAGLTKDEVSELREELGLMPEDITVAIETNLREVTEDQKAWNEAIAAALGVQAKIREQRLNIVNSRLLADGGPVAAGETVVVGDGGVPELFTAGAAGFVTPLDMFQQAAIPAATTNSGGFRDLHVHGVLGEDPIDRAFREARRQSLLGGV